MRPIYRSFAWLAMGAWMLLFSTSAGRAQPFVFENVTTLIGILSHEGAPFNDERIGTGAVWFDYDNDGDLDLYMTQRNGANHLFENQLVETGTVAFTDVAVARGADDSAHDGSGAAAADYDNDGDLDLYLANSDEDVLLRNELVETGSADFTDVTTGSGLQVSGESRGTGPSWGDYDNDGFLDLYVAHHQPLPGSTASTQDRFYHNNSGNGTFTDVTSLLAGDVDGDGLEDTEGKGFIAGWTDFDNDGDLDLFLQNDCPLFPEGNKLWRNDGGPGPLTWVFTEVSLDMGLADELGGLCVNSMGLATGDYNRDGLWDYFYTDIKTATLIRNEGGGLFTDVTVEAGVFEDFVPGTDPAQDRVTWGTVFIDYNLDGFQDIAVAAGTLTGDSSLRPQPNLFYENNGDSTFTDISATAWEEDIRRGRTLVMGDYDQDGDPDLFLVNYDHPVRLLENTSATGNNWLQVKLQGAGPPLSNRDGVGAKVRVTMSDGIVQHYEIRSGSSLGGGDDLAAYFGLGDQTIAFVEVAWPSGVVQQVGGVAVNQRLEIVEDGISLPVELAGFTAVRDGAAVVLSWQTASEQNNAGFEIEHRRGGAGQGAFALIGFVEGQGTTATAHAYQYRVADLAPGQHTFRLRQRDLDGRAGYSPEVTVAVEVPGAYALTPVYPNPFNPRGVFELALREGQQVKIGLYDVLGRRVALVHQGLLEATTTHRFVVEGSALSSGVYVLRVQGERFAATQTVALRRQ